MGPEDRAESTLQCGRVPQWIWRPGDAVTDRSSDGRVSAALAAAGRGLCEGRWTGIVDLGVAVEQGQPDRDHGDQQSRGPHLQQPRREPDAWRRAPADSDYRVGPPLQRNMQGL